jgi:hypothetical protein
MIEVNAWFVGYLPEDGSSWLVFILEARSKVWMVYNSKLKKVS